MAGAFEARWNGGVMDDPGLAGDPGFATLEANEDALEARVAAWTRRHDGEAIMVKIESAGIPAGVVQDGRDLVEEDPHLRARGFYETVAHPRVGPFPHEGVVARLGAAEIDRYAADGVLE